MTTCQHEGFKANCEVNRLVNENGGDMQFSVDVRVECDQCGKPFQFLGLQPGVDLQGARVSLDGLEARLAISPQGVKPNPFQNIVFNITRHT